MTIAYEKCRRFIGERIAHEGKYGTVIGIYPNFLLVRGQNYNFTINYKDMGLVSSTTR